MGRGRTPLVKCVKCGKRIREDKAIVYVRYVVFSTNLGKGDDVTYKLPQKEYYCVECARHYGILEKKKKMSQRKKKKQISKKERVEINPLEKM